MVADDAVTADAALGESEPALAELAVASTLGSVPAGPALRRPPVLAPARGPPFFQSVAIRRKLGEPAQAELFDAR